MMRIKPAISLTALAIALIGCGGPHLGARYGEAYRSAFTVQANRTSRPIAPFDAGDVHSAMTAHRTKPGGQGAGGPGGPGVPLINLDAK